MHVTSPRRRAVRSVTRRAVRSHSRGTVRSLSRGTVRGVIRGPVCDGGFTLIELLITMVILGVITFPLMDVVLGSFTNSATTQARLAESHDEQIAAAYWQQDAASIGIRSSTYDTTAHTFPLLQSVGIAFPCALPAGDTAVAVLGWNRYDTTGTATQITIVWATATVGTQNQLLRLHCTAGALDATAVMAHDLDPANPPVLTCAGSAGSSCTGSGSAVPATLSLRLTIKDPSGVGQPFAVTLTGQRRQT
jgi:prepilin-type N-terminal cleavage/methylation domain-containing protein